MLWLGLKTRNSLYHYSIELRTTKEHFLWKNKDFLIKKQVRCAASNHQRWASFWKKKKANGRWVVIFRLLFNSLRDWHDDCQAPIFEKVTAYVTSSEIATFNQVTSSMIWIEPQVKSPLKEGGDGYGKNQFSLSSQKKKYNASFFVLLSFHDHYQGGFIPRTIIIIVVGSMVLSNWSGFGYDDDSPRKGSFRATPFCTIYSL